MKHEELRDMSLKRDYAAYQRNMKRIQQELASSRHLYWIFATLTFRHQGKLSYRKRCLEKYISNLKADFDNSIKFVRITELDQKGNDHIHLLVGFPTIPSKSTDPSIIRKPRILTSETRMKWLIRHLNWSRGYGTLTSLNRYWTHGSSHHNIIYHEESPFITEHGYKAPTRFMMNTMEDQSRFLSAYMCKSLNPYEFQHRKSPDWQISYSRDFCPELVFTQ